MISEASFKTKKFQLQRSVFSLILDSQIFSENVMAEGA